MKTRLNIYLSPGQHEEIAALSAKRRVSKSSVIEAAVASMLSPDSADAREAAFVRRLDRHTRQLERVERDLAIAIETIALFVRFWLAVIPPLPESAQAAAKAKGVERYRDFVETLGAGCNGATASCARSVSRSGRSSGTTAPGHRLRATRILKRRT
jgi:hypothetical protein